MMASPPQREPLGRSHAHYHQQRARGRERSRSPAPSHRRPDPRQRDRPAPGRDPQPQWEAARGHAAREGSRESRRSRSRSPARSAHHRSSAARPPPSSAPYGGRYAGGGRKQGGSSDRRACDERRDGGGSAAAGRQAQGSRSAEAGAGGVADFSTEFEVAEVATAAEGEQKEKDPHRLAQRQKQVDYGKNTRGYMRYRQMVPLRARRRRGRLPLDPVTPDIHQLCSKRAFEGLVKKWRRMLHEYDPPKDEDEEEIDLEAICNEDAPMPAAEDPPQAEAERAEDAPEVKVETAKTGEEYWEEEYIHLEEDEDGGGELQGEGLDDWDVDDIEV
eukprot:jgi/Tetstr1/453464/TSEL_040445.t1